ncbi:RluA family pseudouridine synthase [Thermoflavimicrobium daqui]|uniref:Pseudouridine synthase n=1 Tax=Thermoflavimicrobium daqui TaxID=2137476 RepID=A0A364K9S9_9BACL|nr:RluA family pseudouridine synthase [Thermoflavimicrobium daqui]RAL27044.1 RluA family pseudouridine synthase [Thermoflavimicrobium daqui]
MKKKQRPSKWMTFYISPEWDGATVETILKQPLLISGRMINRLTRIKGIKLNGRIPWLKKPVKVGDHLQVAIRPYEKSDLKPQPVSFEIVFEDEDIMIIDKPAGIQVHPVRPSDQYTLVHGITYILQERGLDGVVRPVHRLDRDTSGLILIAKNAYMHQLLDRQLREKQITRRYLAMLNRPLSDTDGTIHQPIGKDPKHPYRRIVTPHGNLAITHYHILDQNSKGALLSIELETGRTHQIRAHFAHLGCPLIGDRLYGGDCSILTRQALHSAKISFTHPLSNELCTYISPLPHDLDQVCQTLQLKIPSKINEKN